MRSPGGVCSAAATAIGPQRAWRARAPGRAAGRPRARRRRGCPRRSRGRRSAETRLRTPTQPRPRALRSAIADQAAAEREQQGGAEPGELLGRQRRTGRPRPAAMASAPSREQAARSRATAPIAKARGRRARPASQREQRVGDEQRGRRERRAAGRGRACRSRARRTRGSPRCPRARKRQARASPFVARRGAKIVPAPDDVDRRPGAASRAGSRAGSSRGSSRTGARARCPAKKRPITFSPTAVASEARRRERRRAPRSRASPGPSESSETPEREGAREVARAPLPEQEGGDRERGDQEADRPLGQHGEPEREVEQRAGGGASGRARGRATRSSRARRARSAVEQHVELDAAREVGELEQIVSEDRGAEHAGAAPEQARAERAG